MPHRLNLNLDILMAALQASANGILISDTDGCIEWVNAAFTEMTGYSLEDVKGLSPSLLKSGRHDEEFYAGLWSTISAGKSWHGELINRRKDGSHYFEEMSVTPVESPPGSVSHFIAIKQDVSERHKAQAQLLKSEEQLKAAHGLAALGYVDVDFITGEVIWSRETYGMFGQEPDSTPWSYEKFQSRLSLAEREIMHRAMSAQDSRFENSFRVTLDDGSMRVMHYRGTIFREPSGAPLRCVLAVLDVTSQDAAQARLRMLFEHSRDAHLLFTQAGLVDCNPGALPMLGADSKEHLLGLKMADLSPEFQPSGRLSSEAATEMVTLARRTGFHRFDWLIRGLNGQECPVEVTATPDYVVGQQAMLLVLHDLTERKKHESALENARKEAEAGTQAKSDFLATMSHEIRTPLNGIIGTTSLLIDTPLNDEQLDFLETIRSSGDGLLSIINDVLDFSKIEAGKLELEVIQFNLRPLLDEVIMLVAQSAQSKGLEVRLLDGEIPLRVSGDPVRLRQVLVNLLSNAIKFTMKGSVFLRVDSERAGDGAVSVRFSIIDTGIGIDAKSQDKLFQSFSQADSSTTRKYGGTGLGLAISKRLVEAMNGEIGCKSSYGEGCTFWFTVPLLREADPVPELPVVAQFAGHRALIVDPDGVSRMVLNGYLTRLGMFVTESAGEEHVLRQFERPGRSLFSVAILACRQPGEGGGVALVKTVRSLKPSLPLILLAPRWDLAVTQVMAEIEMTSCLLKPVTGPSVLAALQDAFRTHPPRLQSTPLRSLTRLEDTPGTARILVAEDNRVNQKVTAMILQRLGYHVELANNGQEAVEAQRTMAYDLILMDCQMPEMDGLTATREIRLLEGIKRHTPIIALTANATPSERDRCIESGMDAHLVKPVSWDSLAAAVHQWLEAAR